MPWDSEGSTVAILLESNPGSVLALSARIYSLYSQLHKGMITANVASAYSEYHPFYTSIMIRIVCMVFCFSTTFSSLRTTSSSHPITGLMQGAKFCFRLKLSHSHMGNKSEQQPIPYVVCSSISRLTIFPAWLRKLAGCTTELTVRSVAIALTRIFSKLKD